MKISTLLEHKDGKFYKKGRVAFSKRKGSIRLRIVHNYKYYSLTIKGGITQKALEAAKALADTINGDLAFDRFDTTLQKYDPDHATRANFIEQRKEPDLKEIWEHYKEAKKYKSAKTTQVFQWREIDRLLDILSPKQLKLSEIEYLGAAVLKIRALSTTHRNFQFLNAAITLYTGEDKKLKKQLPPEPKPSIEWFEPHEVRFILEAFRDDRYNSDRSAFTHSFYYPYVAFLAHTGCRPEEALALSWANLIWSSDRCECKVKIDKAYTKGILLPHTKNYKIRTIALSSSLIKILENNYKKSNQNRLIFPGYKGGYLDHGNFRERQWQPILEALVRNGLIRKYLKPYCLRHSYVTNMHHEAEVSLVKIAGLIGDKVETVIKRYTGLKEMDPAKMPNLY
ncbi:tyrosine-type recombinase/integrase [Spirulina sp. 06S082]|uniref:tyrosine-type recombinase/integrase n=1 Tax=Spirulina sp. 06S082 TaxID=3110248 RepID=UPI002B209E48|nr:tyrosine-type recombinase/integrase [Spirulina sp. 06S082]MEA5471687.1 tyrosine-type recombinase/integrase [Spirulina sp. 06S082]